MHVSAWVHKCICACCARACVKACVCESSGVTHVCICLCFYRCRRSVWSCGSTGLVCTCLHRSFVPQVLRPPGGQAARTLGSPAGGVPSPCETPARAPSVRQEPWRRVEARVRRFVPSCWLVLLVCPLQLSRVTSGSDFPKARRCGRPGGPWPRVWLWFSRWREAVSRAGGREFLVWV